MPTDFNKKVYSYLRWSTPEQELGSSKQRQLDYAKSYAKEHGYQYVDTYIDSGVSAFKGKNRESGSKLKSFFDYVNDEGIAENSILIIESLDRLSRENPLDALPKFNEILETGVTIITAADSKEYTKKGLRSDPMSLLWSLMVMIRANEESVRKSDRTSKAFMLTLQNHNKGIIKSGQEPAWVERTLDETNTPTGYKVKENHDTIIQRIFEMYINGMGVVSICNHLNKEDTPRFTAKAKSWHSSYVERLLKSRAVIGEASFKSMHQEEPFIFTDYYPVIIEKNNFELAQRIRKQRHVSKAVSDTCPSFITGIGITFCGYCGASMVTHQAGSAKECRDEHGNLKDWARRMRCRGHSSKAEIKCLGGNSKVSLLENAILDFCSDEVHFASAIQCHENKNKLAIIERRIDTVTQQIKKLTQKSQTQADLIEEGESKEERAEFRKRFQETTASIKAARSELSELESDREQYRLVDTGKIQQGIIDLKDQIQGNNGKAARLKLRQIMLEFVKRIDVYRYGIMAHETNQNLLREMLKNSGFTIQEVEEFISQNEFDKKSTTIVHYHVKFNSGTDRVIRVHTDTGEWSTLDEKELSLGTTENKRTFDVDGLSPQELAAAYKEKHMSKSS